MRIQTLICAGFALAAISTANNAAILTVNDNGDAGPGNCTSICTLRDAITVATGGDTIKFLPGLASPITLTQGELLINKALTIAGPGAGALTVSANNNSRVFDITANSSITGLTIADGAFTGISDTSNDGGAGGSAAGGCVLIASGIAAVLDRVAIHHCVAIGGNGGNGTMGAPGACIPNPPMPPMCLPGGPGGYGGSGGAATGAAVAVNGSLTLSDSSVVDAHATGGNGGVGGIGGPSTGGPPGTPGNGGVGGAASGGAVAISSGASIDIFNSTIAESSGTGGNGGAGASSPPGAANGSGGYATGGLLYVDGSVVSADLEFSTLANGSVFGGTGTQTGAVIANAINAASTLIILSSIVVGAQGNANLCYGSVAAATGSANLSEYTNNDINYPSACNSFSINATFGQTLKPLDASATPAYMPIWHSPAIDAAANCQDLTSTIVTADQHGTERPQGSKCDLGAIEADYIFVDGFGG